MSQMDSDGVEDVVNGQGRLLVGAAGTAMAAAARLIAERTRRQREAAAAQLVSDQARAEADRRLLLVRLEMAKTDQWREQAPLEQVAETLYLARLHERTEPAAAAAIPDLENHVRTRFDRDPEELINERIRAVSDQREAEAVYALDTVERAAGVTGAGDTPTRDAAAGRGQGRGQETRAAQEASPVSSAATTASAGPAATPPTSTSTSTSTPTSTEPLAPTAGPAAAAATQGGTRAPSAGAARRARVRPPTARSRTAMTTAATSAAASWSRSSAPPAQAAQDSAQSAAAATPLQGPAGDHAPVSTSSAAEQQGASGQELARRLLAQHRAAHERSHTHDQALEYGQ